MGARLGRLNIGMRILEAVSRKGCGFGAVVSIDSEHFWPCRKSLFLSVHKLYFPFRREVSTLLRFCLVTVNWLLPVQKIKACAYGICELAFSSSTGAY